jgi:hypothetical protein
MEQIGVSAMRVVAKIYVQRSMPGALQQDDPAMTLAERGIVRPFEERAGPNRQLPTLMGGYERRRK